MLDNETKRRIDTARDILVGKVPDPKSQVEQITIALIYKFMDDMDKEAVSFGGKGTFFTGEYEQYSWTNIFDTKVGGHEMLSLYSEAIVKLNLNPNIPQLFRDIFKNAYLPYRDPETLKLFLKTINEFHYDHSEKLGDAFEYLLSIMGSQGDAGQFRTPRHIIDFIVEILQPKKNESILDPACGTAGFLISSYKHILQANTKKTKGDLLTPDNRKKMMQNFVGYDISPDMVRLSLVNLYLHGFTTPSIYEYDTLTSEDRWSEYYDVILANPPFMSPKGGIKPHKKFTVQANRSEVLFVDYIAEHIHPSTGRAGIIVPEGIIFQSATAYKRLRQLLVDKNYLYAVVSLPAGIFHPYSGVKTSILLMDKTLAKKNDNILFVKIESDGFDLGAQRRAIEQNDLTGCLELLHQYKDCLLNNTAFESDNKNVFVVEKKKIAADANYNLSIDRYRANGNVQQSNFEMVQLGDVCELYQPQTISGKEILEKGEYKVFGANGVIGFYDKYNHEDSEVLITCRGATCGTINFSEPKSWVTGNAMVAKPKDERLDKIFLLNLLRATDLTSVISGSAQPQITRTSLSPFEIPLPPLEIQNQIVNKIESFQKIIDGAKQIVENYKPQIEIDENWVMVELGSVCDVISGFSFDSKEFSVKNEIKSIKITNVGVGNFVETETDFLPKEYLERYKKYSASTDDIVIALTRSIIGDGLKVCLVPNSYNGSLVNQRVAVIKCDNKKISSHFVLLQLNSAASFNYIEEKARSLMQPNLSIKDLSVLPIAFPSFDEQQEIVKRIEEEQALVNSNKKLIEIFEQKIKDEINKLWQAAPKEYAMPEEKLSIAAEE